MMSQRLMTCRERILRFLGAFTTNNKKKKTFLGHLLFFNYQIGCFAKLVKFLPKINEGFHEVDTITMSILKTRA